MSETYNLPNMPELEDLITEMLENVVYGWKPVYHEEHVFETGTDEYTLVAGSESTIDIHDILYVNGTVDGTQYVFVETTDYEIYDSTGDGKNDTFRWFVTGTNPDDETTFYVSYRYQVTPTGITDVQPGSVTRTLIESVAIQLMRTFLRLQDVARDSFVDTATGRELDLLARLVGVIRNEASRATGYITLRRDPSNTTSVVNIPIGTKFSTIASSTSTAVQFQTTKAARIRSGESVAVTYTDTSDPDHLEPWVEIEAVSSGTRGNVSSGSVVRNLTASPQIIYVYNDSTYDKTGEQFDGDGSTQVFDMSHSPASRSSRGINYIQYKSGFVEQPTSSTTIRFELTTGSGGYTGGDTVTCTVYGQDQTGTDASEPETLDDTTYYATTTTQFSRIDYITFANSDEKSEGIGEGVGTGYKITVENSGQTETYLDDQAAGTRADGGWLDMVADEDYISLYLWQNNSWTLKSIGTTGSGTNHYEYTDEGSDAGLVKWNDGLGGGSTWTSSSPYYTQYDAGPDSDGQNIRIEYYPISGETGTGEATSQETGITAITVTEEYKYGWLDQPSSASVIYVSFTNGSAVNENWSGTVVIHGTTTTGGEDDEYAMTYSSEYTNNTGTTQFSRIDYVSFANSDNPAEGPGEGTASSTYARIGNSGTANAYMDEQQCGTRVDGGWLSMVGVDSGTTLKVYVYDSGWSLKTQAGAHYTYTDSGNDAGLIDWGSTWDWSTSPYVNDHAAGEFGDGRNIKIEYVPAYDQYLTDGDQLKLEGAPTLGSVVTVSYTWDNTFSDGANTETDDALRLRTRTAISTQAKGTLDAIRSAVLDVDGIIGVVVDDYSTDPTIEIGEVHIFAWTATGLLDAGTRTLVAAAVDDVRPAGVKPIVYSPTPIYLAIEVTVKVDKSSSSSLTQVETDAEEAITDFIDTLSIGSPLYKTALIEVIEEIDAVKYVDLSSLVVYGYDTDTSTAVSQESPYSANPYWHFEDGTQNWSSNGNIIYINSGYVFRPDTDTTGGGTNYAIDVTAEYD